MRALALFIEGRIPVFGCVSYFVLLQPTAPALLFDALMPILGALVLGVFIGKLVPGRKGGPGRRTFFGAIGGIAGVVLGYIIVYGVVQDPGPVYLTVVAVCAFLGAVGGAVLSR
jgi:peptidoglycan/LPS O-acetylase OafA/YrhL